jgi:hypothetical protein
VTTKKMGAAMSPRAMPSANPATRAAKALTIALWITALVTLAALSAESSFLGMLAHVDEAASQVSQDSLTELGGWVDRINSVWVLAFLATAVAWCRWLYQAYGRLRQVGTGRTRSSPVRAVLSFFIPVVNVVQPYRYHAELWARSATQNAQDPDLPERVGRLDFISDSSKTPRLIKWWWGLFWASNLVSYIALRLASDPQLWLHLDLASNIVHMAATLAAIKMVTAISRMQATFPALDSLSTGAPVALDGIGAH